jgi:3-(3-hydroxy-phenyl)propionate hydroxylase
MPPYAGQGLSCGLHDVANLSWRLWLVTRHGADLRLLEDYDLERRPVNRAAIALSVFNRVLVAPDTALRRGLRDTVLGLINAVPGGARRLSQLQLRPFRLYGQGTIVVNGGLRKHVGQILPQWRTQTRRGRQALDDVLGPGFSLIAFGDVSWTSCDASALAFWGDLGAQRLTIPAEEVADMDGELTRFMAPLMGHIAVVRPDRIIMAVCRANRLAQVTELCRQLLTGH